MLKCTRPLARTVAAFTPDLHVLGGQHLVQPDQIQVRRAVGQGKSGEINTRAGAAQDLPLQLSLRQQTARMLDQILQHCQRAAT
jgi:hypothetical protein